MIFNKFDEYRLIAYSDVDWAADFIDRKSTIGSFIMIINCPVL